MLSALHFKQLSLAIMWRTDRKVAGGFGETGQEAVELPREGRQVEKCVWGGEEPFKRCNGQDLMMSVVCTSVDARMRWPGGTRGRRNDPLEALIFPPPLLGPEGDLALPPLTCDLLPQLFLLTISIFVGLGQLRNTKGKRKGPGWPGTLAPGPHQMPLDLVSQGKPYARMEEYERNLGEMVAQLRNSSEPARRKCGVDLQLWLSSKRSLSPWSYRWTRLSSHGHPACRGSGWGCYLAKCSCDCNS